MKGPQERVRSLLIESLSGICCSEIKFKDSLKVEGLFGITVDEEDVFLVSVGETFVHNRAISAVSENEFQHGAQMSAISQQLSDMNDNSLPVIAAKKQKIDLSDLQNVTQYLNNHEQVSSEHEMEGVMLCGDTLTQSDLDNANSLAEMSQADGSGGWAAFPFSKLQQQQIDKSKMMAAAIKAMRLQHQQTNEQASVAANNVVALQQLRQSYLAVQQQNDASRDDHTTNALEQFQLETHALEQSVAVAALQQQLAINLADPASLSLLGNKTLVSGFLLDQLSHCVADDDSQQVSAAVAQSIFQRHHDNGHLSHHNQSQSDSDSGMDSKKNASLIQALSGAGGLGNAVLQLNSHHIPSKHFRQLHGNADAMMLHLEQGSSSSINNIMEGSVGTSKEDDDDNNIDTKLWISSANSEIVTVAPPVYSNLLSAAASSASSSSKSPSPTWLSHHHSNHQQQQQTLKMSPDSVVDNNLVNSIIESSSTPAALAISSNQFIVGPIYPASSSTPSSSAIQQHAFNLSDLMQQEQLLQQQQLQQQLQQQQQQQQQQQAVKPQQQTPRQQNRGRKESRRSWTSNNKPNSCPYAGCTKTYFFTHDLKRHLRQKHGEVLSGEAMASAQMFTTADRNSLRHQQQQLPQLQQQLQAHQFILNDRKDLVLLMQPQLQTKNEVEDDDNLTSGSSSVRDDVENANMALAGQVGGNSVLGIIGDKTQDDEMLPA